MEQQDATKRNYNAKSVFNMNNDSFWLLVKDLCSWAHRVKVVNAYGGVEFEKGDPIWGKGIYANGKVMVHRMKLDEVKEQLTSRKYS